MYLTNQRSWRLQIFRQSGERIEMQLCKNAVRYLKQCGVQVPPIWGATPQTAPPSPASSDVPSNLQWSLWRLAEVRYNRHGPPPVSNHTGPPGSGLMAPQWRIDV